MRRLAGLALLALAALVVSSRSEAKDFETLVIVGAAGDSIKLRPPAGVVDSFFDFSSPYNEGLRPRRAARRGGYVLLYPLAPGGFPGIPGRFYPRTGAACFSWRRGGAGPCRRPNATLLRVLRPSARLRPFHRDETAPRIARLEPGVGNLNLVVGMELALGRERLSQSARTPLGCLHFVARWASGYRGPRRLCLGRPGVYARGRLYPLGPHVWRIARANAPYGQRLGSAVELLPLAEKRLRLCRSSRLVRPACPSLVPRVRAAYLAHLARELAPPHPLVTFDLERGGEYPGRPERNRPPRMAHLGIAAGDVWRAAPIWTIGSRRVTLRDGLMRRARSRTYALGPARWGGRAGRLYLAASYPRGGWLGNHLIFRWRTGRSDYVVSLHAWEPLTETAATLRAIVVRAGKS